MLKGKHLIIATKCFAKENRFLSWYYTVSTFILLLLALACTTAPIFFLFRLLISIFVGLVTVRLFVIYHDYLHESILQKSKVADILFALVGMHVLAPKTVWKRTHDYHHKHNSKFYKLSIGSYPVYTKNKFQNCTKRERFNYLFIRHPLTIIFGYIFTFMYGMCINPLMNGFKKHIDSFFALVFHFLGQFCIVYFLGWETLLFFCVIPNIVSGAIGSYLFYVQHNFPDVHFHADQEWTYESSALESSSHLVMGPFLNWITGNIGYHHIHHLNSKIPFYKLPNVMLHFKELQNPKTITLAFKDIVACFKLKVWDTEKKKMINI